MAYVSTEIITKARSNLKLLNKEYGMKATLSGKGSMSMRLYISEGSIDFIENHYKVISEYRRESDLYVSTGIKSGYLQVNHYWTQNSFDSKALQYLDKAKDIMMQDHWDKSDTQSDYFYCSFYIHIQIGKWDKPYKFTG
jgi:hypothetical protein